jgi:hypothetical protein
MATIDVKDAAGSTVAIEKPLVPGRAAAASSRPVALSNEDKAVLGAITDAVWSSGDGTLIALLKAIATAATDTATASPVKLDQTSTNNQIALGNSPAANTAKIYTGTFIVAGSTLTRPANTTAYTANDSISDNATAGSVTAKSSNNLSDTNDHPIDLAEIALDSTDTGPGTAGIQIRLHLFNSDPTASSGVVGGDNAAWSNKKAGWIGSFSGTMRLFSDGSKGVLIPDEGTLRMVAPVSGAKNLYYQLQTLGAFTPSANSTTFIPTFKGFQARAA